MALKKKILDDMYICKFIINLKFIQSIIIIPYIRSFWQIFLKYGEKN